MRQSLRLDGSSSGFHFFLQAYDAIQLAAALAISPALINRLPFALASNLPKGSPSFGYSLEEWRQESAQRGQSPGFLAFFLSSHSLSRSWIVFSKPESEGV